MTIDEIRELIYLLKETGIEELEVQRSENRVRIRRSPVTTNREVLVSSASPGAGPGVSQTIDESANFAPGPAAAAADDPRVITVKSPIVGTYYDAPSPGAPPFIKVGDSIEPRQVLCIIESMKLMNEIEAEVAGTVLAKLVENGRPVEYGEALYTILPR
jgi:acetyl-CoA carboxylase biotin carboxyl carrier protein